MAADVMSRAQAFEYVHRVGAAMLGGHALPDWPKGLSWVEADDIADALHAFTRTLAEGFDAMPEFLSDDLAFQELVRSRLDAIFSDLAVEMEAAISKMRAN